MKYRHNPIKIKSLISEYERLSESIAIDNLARDFVQDVLKLGTKNNVFDQYLKRRKISVDDYLNEFMIAVQKKLSEYTF